MATVEPTGGTGTGTGPTVPAAYQADVLAAAKALGIPSSVVAAQIQLESDWNPNARSSAGAEGIAQFEPATFAQYGTGSPYNVSDAFAAYTKYMAMLLKDEGGDIRKALEAYNAGPGDLPAGSGYASKILTNADVVDSTATPGTAGSGTGGSSGSLLSFPSEITGFFSKGIDDLASAGSWFSAFTRPATYVRIGAGVLGTMCLIAAIICLALEAKEA